MKKVITKKDRQRAIIEKHTQQYLDSGGTITRIDKGQTANSEGWYAETIETQGGGERTVLRHQLIPALQLRLDHNGSGSRS